MAENKSKSFKPNDTSNVDTDVFVKGMIKDSHESFVGKENWVHCRNCINNSAKGDAGTIGNEPANLICVQTGFVIIGAIYLYGDSWIIFSGNDSWGSEIGLFDDSKCEYTTLVNDQCLNFKHSNLITGAAKENYDCTWQIYWDDGLNPSRTLNLGFANSIPENAYVPWFQEQVSGPGIDGSDCYAYEDIEPKRLNCDLIRLAPLMKTPCIDIEKGDSPGQLPNGSYQAYVAYTINEQQIGDYIGVSNIQPLFDNDGTACSLNIKISNLDENFDFYKLVLLSNQQQQPTAIQVGFYSTKQTTISIDYIPTNKATSQQVPLQNLTLQNPAYEKSDKMIPLNDYLLRISPTTNFDFNYQPLANNITAKWVSVEYPAEYYKNGGNKPTFMRDEQYAFFIRFIYQTGEKSSSYHIPGREATDDETNSVLTDGNNILRSNETEPWQVSNTASVDEFDGVTTTDDGGVILSKGQMGYWESTELYPSEDPHGRWGDLCGKPIRHHKFPEEQTDTTEWTVDRSNNDNQRMRILGVEFDNIAWPIDNSGKPISNIVGYEILVGSREGNKSILSKGLFRNMKQYPLVDTFGDGINQGSVGLHANYPYNSTNNDVFLTTAAPQFWDNTNPEPMGQPGTGYCGNSTNPLNCNNFYTFHSPETSFQRPYLNPAEVKTYGWTRGIQTGSFRPSEGHPKVTLLRDFAAIIAAVVGVGYAISKMRGKRATELEVPSGITLANPSPLNTVLIEGAETGFTQGSLATPGIAEAAYYTGTGLILEGTLQPLNLVQQAAFGEAIGNRKIKFEGTDVKSLPNLGQIVSGVFMTFHYAAVGGDIVIDFIYNVAGLRNHAYKYNSYGLYSDTFELQEGSVYRNNITKGRYVGNTLQDFGSTNTAENIKINNLHRPATVTIQTAGTFGNLQTPIWQDDNNFDSSRFTIGTLENWTTPTQSYISYIGAHYVGLKFAMDNQYGQLDGIKQLPIPCAQKFIRPGFTEETEPCSPCQGDDWILGNCIAGCTDPLAVNYNPTATNDDCTCVYVEDVEVTPDTLVPFTENLDDDTFVPGEVFKSSILFGGDCYINRYNEKVIMPFFWEFLNGQPDKFAFDYRQYMNVGFARYWMDTTKYDIHNILAPITNFQFDWTDGNAVPSAMRNLDRPPGFAIGDTSDAGTGVYLANGPVLEDVENQENTSTNSMFILRTAYMYTHCSGINDFFVESELNVGLRHQGESTDQKHYDWADYTDIQSLFHADIIEKGNYYKYDFSLSKSNMVSQMVTYGLIQPRDYDPIVADTCYDYYTKRIIYSNQAHKESKKDFWRVYLPNNYQDFKNVPTTVKPISKSGALILFPHIAPQLFQGVDTLSTDFNTKLTIGDGGLFNDPMQQISTADLPHEYGSCENSLSVINTPAGIYYMSQAQGKIFNYAQSLTNIADAGMKQWFNTYLPSRLLKAFPELEGTKFADNPVIGIGCQAVYDPNYDIVYFSKKDYEPCNTNQCLQFDPENQMFFVNETECLGVEQVRSCPHPKYEWDEELQSCCRPCPGGWIWDEELQKCCTVVTGAYQVLPVEDLEDEDDDENSPDTGEMVSFGKSFIRKTFTNPIEKQKAERTRDKDNSISFRVSKIFFDTIWDKKPKKFHLEIPFKNDEVLTVNLIEASPVLNSFKVRRSTKDGIIMQDSKPTSNRIYNIRGEEQSILTNELYKYKGKIIISGNKDNSKITGFIMINDEQYDIGQLQNSKYGLFKFSDRIGRVVGANMDEINNLSCGTDDGTPEEIIHRRNELRNIWKANESEVNFKLERAARSARGESNISSRMLDQNPSVMFVDGEEVCIRHFVDIPWLTFAAAPLLNNCELYPSYNPAFFPQNDVDAWTAYVEAQIAIMSEIMFQNVGAQITLAGIAIYEDPDQCPWIHGVEYTGDDCIASSAAYCNSCAPIWGGSLELSMSIVNNISRAIHSNDPDLIAIPKDVVGTWIKTPPNCTQMPDGSPYEIYEYFSNWDGFCECNTCYGTLACEDQFPDGCTPGVVQFSFSNGGVGTIGTVGCTSIADAGYHRPHYSASLSMVNDYLNEGAFQTDIDIDPDQLDNVGNIGSASLFLHELGHVLGANHEHNDQAFEADEEFQFLGDGSGGPFNFTSPWLYNPDSLDDTGYDYDAAGPGPLNNCKGGFEGTFDCGVTWQGTTEETFTEFETGIMYNFELPFFQLADPTTEPITIGSGPLYMVPSFQESGILSYYGCEKNESIDPLCLPNVAYINDYIKTLRYNPIQLKQQIKPSLVSSMIDGCLLCDGVPELPLAFDEYCDCSHLGEEYELVLYGTDIPATDDQCFDDAIQVHCAAKVCEDRECVDPVYNDVITEIDIQDSDYFKDVSWTASYDPKIKGWVSFHDWHPELNIQSHNHFMTTNTRPLPYPTCVDGFLYNPDTGECEYKIQELQPAQIDVDVVDCCDPEINISPMNIVFSMDASGSTHFGNVYGSEWGFACGLMELLQPYANAGYIQAGYTLWSNTDQSQSTPMFVNWNVCPNATNPYGGGTDIQEGLDAGWENLQNTNDSQMPVGTMTIQCGDGTYQDRYDCPGFRNILFLLSDQLSDAGFGGDASNICYTGTEVFAVYANPQARCFEDLPDYMQTGLLNSSCSDQGNFAYGFGPVQGEPYTYQYENGPCDDYGPILNQLVQNMFNPCECQCPEGYTQIGDTFANYQLINNELVATNPFFPPKCVKIECSCPVLEDYDLTVPNLPDGVDPYVWLTEYGTCDDPYLWGYSEFYGVHPGTGEEWTYVNENPAMCQFDKQAFVDPTYQGGGIWKHNVRCDLFNNYYSIQYPWEIELVESMGQSVNTIRSIEYQLESYQYKPKFDIDGCVLNFGCDDRWHDLMYNFDEAIIYNSEQVSGLLVLNQQTANINDTLQYPIIGTEDIQILYSKVEQKYRFDQFWDITNDRNISESIFITQLNGYIRDLNASYMNYDKPQLERKKFRHYTNNLILKKRVQYFVNPTPIIPPTPEPCFPCEDFVGIGCVPGCTDPSALNYFGGATADNCTCIYAQNVCPPGSICGCTDSTALNYYPEATVDDGTCIYQGEQIYTNINNVPEIFDELGNPIDPAAFLHTRKMILKLVNTKINLSIR